MTDTAKTTLWVIIILVLVGGIWWFVGSNPDTQIPPPQPIQQVNDVQVPPPEVVQPQDESTSVSVQDKTDMSLEADLSKVDDQLSALSADSAI